MPIKVRAFTEAAAKTKNEFWLSKSELDNEALNRKI